MSKGHIIKQKAENEKRMKKHTLECLTLFYGEEGCIFSIECNRKKQRWKKDGQH